MNNPYLKAKREKFEELRAAIKTVQDVAVREERDLSDVELRQVREYAEQAREVATDIEELSEVERRADAVREMAGQLAGDGAGDGAGGGWQKAGYNPDADRQGFLDAAGVWDAPPKIAPSREESAELWRAAQEMRSVRVALDPVHTRAAVTTTETGVTAQALAQQQPREPRRLALAAGLPVQRVSGVEQAKYPVFGAGAADVAAEGALKPEYAAITPGATPPQLISVWTDVTLQVRSTWPGFDTALRNKLARLIAVREDALLVSTVLGTAGIQTLDHSAQTGMAPGDSLLEAAALVVGSDVSAEPNVVVINPADVRRIFGQSVGMSGEFPENALRLRLHGMTCYVSSAVTAGTALVGAWRESSWFLSGALAGMHGVVYMVDATSQMKNNIATLLGEEAAGIAVTEPAGFVNVTFAPA